MPETVALREPVEADLPILFEHQRDPEANEMAAFAAREWEAFVAHARRIRRDPSVCDRTILVDGRVAGSIVAWEADGETDVGYWLGRESWGRGIATRALEAFLRVVTVRPLHARVAKHNIASMRVLEHAGFRPVGELPPGPFDGVVEILMRLGGAGAVPAGRTLGDR